MFCRFFFVARAIFNYSQYKTPFVNKKCLKFRVHPDNWFIFKLFLVKNKVLTVLAIFFISIFFFSVIILCFEVEYFMTSGDQGLHHPFFTSMYFIMITLSTIGYGDYPPSTVMGRVVIMIATVWGAVLLSLFVTVVSGLFEMSKNENDAINSVDLSKEAVNVIDKFYKYYLFRKNNNFSPKGVIANQLLMQQDFQQAFQTFT